jgi:hypothetical protein
MLTCETIVRCPVGPNPERSILELKVGLVRPKDEPCVLVLPSMSSRIHDALSAYHI